MNKKTTILSGLNLLIFIFLASTIFSQVPTVQITPDKNDILIGEQVRLRVRTFYPLNSAQNSYALLLPDSIQHFELIDRGKPDTIIFKDNSRAVEQLIIYTSFDSGRWLFPALRVNIESGKSDTSLNLFTVPFPVNVSYALPDSTNQLRDIKPVIEVRVADYFWYYFAAGVLLFSVAILILFRHLQRKKNAPAKTFDSTLTPYEEAMQELEKLKQYDLQKATEIKLYYTRLSEVFRRYFGRKQHINLRHNTTGDLLIKLAANNFPQENIAVLATVLRCSDAVKFAKYLPTILESEECVMKMKETINLIEG